MEFTMAISLIDQVFKLNGDHLRLKRRLLLLDAYGFTELTMLNLFQSYSTTQSGIDTSSTTDFNKYQMLFSQTDAIIIVWGMGNEYTTEKSKALKVLKKYERKLFCIKKDEKYPLHPSRIHYNCSSLVKCSVGNTIIS